MTIQVGDLEIAYRRTGAGPPLVLVHGGASDGREWRPQLAGLGDALELIAWDEPGAGGSSDPPDEFGLIEFADCLAGLIGELGCSPAHVCGLSWGGTLALELYRRHPGSVRSLILADTYAGWKGSLSQAECDRRVELALAQESAPAEEFAPSLPGLFSEDPDPAVVAELDEIMAATRPGALRRVVVLRWRRATSATCSRASTCRPC